MNYKKIYFQIIRNRRNNPAPLPLDERNCKAGEMHHIKPRSFGGLDTSDNLIRLTAREHFIVHFLLYKIYKHRVTKIFGKSKREIERYKKMTCAFNFMVNIKFKSQKKLNKKINNRVFEQLRNSAYEQQTKYFFELIKNMFDFYIKNNLSPKKINVLNKKFNTNFTYNTLKTIFNKHNLKITNHRENSFFKQKYSRKIVEEMFDFYINNNIYPKTISVLNEKFNTNFTYSTLQQLFSKHKLKISEHRDSVVLGRSKMIKIFDFIDSYMNSNALP